MTARGPAWLVVAAALAAACGQSADRPRDRPRERAASPGPAGGLHLLDPPAAAGALGPNLAREGDAVWASWIEPAGAEGPPWRLRVARLGSGPGRAWSAASTVAEGRQLVANWADFPGLVATARGRLFAHWLAQPAEGAEAYGVELASSDDRGSRFRRLGPAHDDHTATEHGFVTLLAEGDGARVVWLDGRETARDPPGAMTLRTALVTDEVTGPELLDDRVCDCCATDAAWTSRGPVVVYRDRDADEVRDVAVVRRVDGRWTAPATVHRDSWRIAGCPVNGPAVAAAGDRVVVAWFTAGGDRPTVEVAFSHDAGATFAAPIEVDGPVGRRAPVGRVDVAIAAEGEATIVWLASDREEGVLFARRVRSDGALGESIEIARAAVTRAGGFPRIVRVGVELVVAWTDARTQPSHVRVAILAAGVLPAPEVRRAGGDAASAPARGPALGAPAPGVEAKTLAGAPASLASLRGEAVLLHVWATWCEPCRQELPVLASLYERHRAAGLRIVGVSVDRELAAQELREFVDRRRIPYDVWQDPEDRISRALGVDTLPASFLIDRSGRIVWRRAGVIEADDAALDAALAAALAR